MMNVEQGRAFYREAQASSRSWFVTQVAIWPDRADERYTTNISFLYGAFLEALDSEAALPPVSHELMENFKFLARGTDYAPKLNECVACGTFKLDRGAQAGVLHHSAFRLQSQASDNLWIETNRNKGRPSFTSERPLSKRAKRRAKHK